MAGDWDVIMGDDEYGGVGASDADLIEALSVSGYEIVGGNGTSEIVGRAAARPGVSQRMNNARAVNPNAIAVRQRALSQRRRFPLGFVPTTVTTLNTLAVPAAPQNLFRPERVVIPSDIAFDFGVVDIKVGNQSQLVSGGEVPGAVFTEVATDTQVTFQTAEVGNQISMSVRNKSGVSIEFSAATLGTVAMS